LSPWLELCRAAVADVEAVLEKMPSREERERRVGRGKGGDLTGALDEAAERAVLAHFALDGVRIVSEEIGIKGEGEITVLVDPIDGSQNAERAIPYFALSVAVAEGTTIDDVVFGYVYDFGASEEWTAVRGGGAFLDGTPLTGRPKDSIELLSIEATKASLVLDRLQVLAPLADRVRIMGAQAITFCHLAAGRTDAVAVLKPARTVDFAAAQLLVRERGFAIGAIDGPELGTIPLDLEPRSRICAAGTEELLAQIARALGAN
jgi:myo-inositol-1(or 4)-monophosphatase